METLKIFDDKFHKIIENEVKNIFLETKDERVNDIPSKLIVNTKIDNSLSCSYCRIEFTDINQQREHYKLDWHRYNLKQSLLTKNPITEDQFIELTNKDDLSSISGSDTDDIDENSDNYLTAQGRIFLQNDKQQTFSLYSCLLYDKKDQNDEITNGILLERLNNCCRLNTKWTILMLGGGHFAGAIYTNTTPIQHKTFHCYTVRCGQGGQQSSRDNKTGGSHPKSAGASLRRYNEQSLIQHVRNIVELWRKDIDESSLIIYRASGPYNRSVLFGGSTPLLNRNDPRLRTVPFSTRRATFAEIKRVHSLLIQAQIYDSTESALGHYNRHKLPEQLSKLKSIRKNRSKSRDIPDRSLNIEQHSTSDNGDYDIGIDNEVITFDLECFQDSLTPEERKIGQQQQQQRRKRKPKKSKTQKLKEQNERRLKEIFDTLIRGDINKLQELANNDQQQQQQQDEEEGENLTNFYDEIIDNNGNSFLHIAALNDHKELLEFLLENHANPCCKNQKQQTPYTCTNNHEIRETLKQFARDNPEKYNYNKAHIPINALTQDELAEKRKQQRKIKREKEKIKKKENDIKRQEELAKERFLQLSDREKRALAAERRMMNQSGNVMITRCFNCATDITGKVPFEYCGNRFCTVDCLKTHRLTNPNQLS